MEHRGYVWFLKKLKRCCVWFGTFKKWFVIWDPELLNSIAETMYQYEYWFKKSSKNDSDDIWYSFFGKTMEMFKNIVKKEKRWNYLVSEPNVHTTKFITENLLAIALAKTQILMNKPVYSRLSVLQLSKTVMYEFRYDYVKPK